MSFSPSDQDEEQLIREELKKHYKKITKYNRYPSILKNKNNPNKEEELKRLLKQQEKRKKIEENDLNKILENDKLLEQIIKQIQKEKKKKGRRVRLSAKLNYRSKKFMSCFTINAE